jgi:hypothetical protein
VQMLLVWQQKPVISLKLTLLEAVVNVQCSILVSEDIGMQRGCRAVLANPSSLESTGAKAS